MPDLELTGRTIRLRLVEVTDAEFILKLRLDKRYSRYLSEVSPRIQDQIDWIRNYKHDEAAGRQYYFIIERMDNGHACGTIRIYAVTDSTFRVGSWILSEDKTMSAAAESGYLAYQYGFERLGRKLCLIDVRRDNQKALAVHRHLGAKYIGKDDDNHYMEYRAEQFAKLELRHKVEKLIE